jgi:fatty-acyl-CoA synthase
MEATQRAFDAAIEPLRVDGTRAEVTVRNDPTLGTLAVARVTGAKEASREAIVKRCAELLGGFQIRHAVEFEG